jgi:FkbM family methyltransferase
MQVDGRAFLTVLFAPWSGVLELQGSGDTRVVDMYAERHRLGEIELPGAGRRSITVRLTADRNPASQGHEAWIHEFRAVTRQPWLSRVTRLSPVLELAHGDQGDFLTIRGDIGISHAIRTMGCWGPEQVALFERLVVPGQTALDVGANIGHHSVVLSGLVGARGRVLAFEPQPFVHRVLESNLLLNGCSNAHAHRLALGASPGLAMMNPMDYESGDWNVGGLGLQGSGHAGATDATGTEVRVATLDEIVAMDPVDFIKCDAQGFDFEVVKGAVQTLQRCKPIVLLEVAPLSMPGGPGAYRAMYEMLMGMGYVLVDPLDPDLRKPAREATGVPEEWDVLALQPQHVQRLTGGAHA